MPAGSPPAGDAKKEPHETDELCFTFGPRQWRVRGVGKNLAFDTLRVQLRVLVQSGGQRSFHLDNLDLCNAKHRNSFIAQAHAETHLDEQLLKRDLAQVFFKVEELQEQRIHQALEPKQKEVIVPDAERTAALELLRDPKLLDRILADFDRCGVVGEQVNKLVGYLATISRKLDEPLAVIVQSASAAGKSSLMEAILAFVPEEQRVKYSAMTGQSLYYLGDSDLTHKVLAIVEEEGAERASYALKLLQSEGELTIASTGKNAHTGRMTAQEYHVKGPVMIMLTTTAIDLDEELMNRCIVLTVDESREQTRAIHALQRQRETVEGMLLKLQRDATIQLASQRAAVVASAPGCESLRPATHVPGRPHPHAPRPHEIPGADPHHRAVAPIPAAHQDGRPRRLHRGNTRRHRRRQPHGRRSARPQPRRPAAADAATPVAGPRVGGRGMQKAAPDPP